MAFNGRFVLNMIHLAAKQGANTSDLIALSEKTPKDLLNETSIIEDNKYNRIVEAIVSSTEDQLFGLHAGENLNLSAAGLILHLVQNSETIKQAYELCCHYTNLGCSALPMKLIENGNHYELVFNPNKKWQTDSELAFQQTTLGIISFKIREFHSLTYLQHSPVKVHLTWKQPEKFNETKNSFGCPVVFSQKEVTIYFKKEQIEASIISSDYALLNTLISHAEKISNKKAKQAGFIGSVSDTIVRLMKPEFPSLDQVASHLNISTRTLQRKIKNEKSSFKKITEDLKKEFALAYIKQDNLSISEIAYLLNYTEASAFSRSFKRWTGLNPVQYRKK